MSRKYASFRESLLYVYQSRFFILAGIIIFFISSLITFFSPEHFSFFDELLRDILLETTGLTTFQLIFFIFQNNLMSAFLALFLGILIGIIPLANAVLNGAVLGYVISRAVPLVGFGVIWRLVPHGIFELPAIFIAIGLGIKLGFFVFDKDPRASLRRRLGGSARVFIYVILPLLIIAACIEGLLIHFS